VERINRQVETVELAERYFSRSETEKLRSLPAGEQVRQSFCYWTLKESYVKARGLGLALPLNQLSFTVEHPIRVEFDKRLADDATPWRFALLDAPPCHLIAVSVKTGGPTLSLRANQIAPPR
jgi:4'-phosphopantetheinyl transferase